MGHQILRPDLDPPIPCMDHSNCWAALASGSGIARRFGRGAHTTTKEIFAHVLTEGDVRDLRRCNAQAFGNIVSAYDPEVIVVMGSLGLTQFDSIVPGQDEIAGFTVNRPVPEVMRCRMQQDIGILGAYYAAAEMVARKQPG